MPSTPKEELEDILVRAVIAGLAALIPWPEIEGAWQAASRCARANFRAGIEGALAEHKRALAMDPDPE